MYPNEHEEYVHSVGIFVINNAGEILLHKIPHNSLSTVHLWEVPFIQITPFQAAYSAAKNYTELLGAHCQLHEAFIRQDLLGHVIIAVFKQESSLIHFATDIYKWMPLNKLLRDIIDYPSHYTPWFQTALEDVILYLKDLLKDEPLKHMPTSTQFR